jgi:death-on-curing protein
VNEPLWISEEIVRLIHHAQIEQHGGSLGIRDENLLAASLARSRHLLAYSQPDLFELPLMVMVWQKTIHLLMVINPQLLQ